VGVRGKLFLISVVLIVSVGSVSALYLESRLRSFATGRMERELNAQASMAAIALSAVTRTATAADPALDRLATGLAARLRWFDGAGRLIADSQASLGEVEASEVRLLSPEVLRGAERQIAVQTSDGRGGTLEASAPLHDVDEVVAALRLLTLVTGSLGLIAAIVMTGLASYFMSRTLRALMERAQAIAGDRRTSPPLDEISGLAGSIDQMATRLEGSVRVMADEKNRFETVLDALSEAVIALDATGRITLVNRATLTLLNLETPPTGQTLLETVRIAELGDLVQRMQSLERTSVEFDLPRNPQQRVLARATRPRSGGGMVIVLHDVSEVRRLELVRRDFVANVSHELRTPVTIIRANAETLLDGALEDQKKSREFVEAMMRHADRLTRLVTDLLDLSRIEAGRYPIKPQRLRLKPALKRSVDLVERPAREKGLSLTLELDEALSAQGDPRAFDQVVGNLLDNAVKYTPAGGQIEVRAKAVAEGIHIEVSDDGPGIEARHRDRIFERFYRVDPGRSRDVGGTGLGLSIVKHLVEAMDGTVGLEPREPHGSMFWFVLPAAPLEAGESRSAPA